MGQQTSIGEIGAVFVPVRDSDQALAFYVDVLGFEKRVDFVYGPGIRWIEVAPPGAANTLALVPSGEGAPADREPTCCALASRDIAADHAALHAAGVRADAEIATTGRRRAGLISVDAGVADPVPAQFFFRDPDGNRFLVVGSG